MAFGVRIHALPFGRISASLQRGDRDPGRETCELLLPPPGPADCRAERFQADIHVIWRQAELLRRDLVKRLLVYLGDFEAASAAREPKGIPHSEFLRRSAHAPARKDYTPERR